MPDEVMDAIEMIRAGFGPRLLAIGVGGSFGRGTSDTNSDIDLFLVVDADLPSAVGIAVGIGNEWGHGGCGQWVPGFGWQVVAVSPNRGLLELFVNTPSTMVPDQSWRDTVVIHDPEGLMASAARAGHELPDRDGSDAIIAMIALGTHSLRKQAARGRLHDAHRRLDDLRRQTARLTLFHVAGERSDPKFVFRAQLWTESEWSERLRRCVPSGHGRRELADATAAVRELIDRSVPAGLDGTEGHALKAIHNWLQETQAFFLERS